MSIQRSFWRRCKDAIAIVRGVRGYDAASGMGWLWGNLRGGGNRSANSELASAGPVIRARTRELYRNNATARAAVEALVSTIVGTGIDVEPNTGDQKIDKRLRDAWRAWAECAGADGRQSLWDLQRQAVRSWANDGGALWQIVALSDMSRPIPSAIHPLEVDQLAPQPVKAPAVGTTFVSGVEVNRYGRPVAYHITEHPGDVMSAYLMGVAGSGLLPGGALTAPEFQGATAGINGLRIDAKEIIHAYEALRPGQTVGEPRLCSVLGRIRQEGELIDYELCAAKVGAAPAVAITTQGGGGSYPGLTAGSQGISAQGNTEVSLEPGAVARLLPGESVSVIENKRPSQGVAPFSRFIRGGIAAALGLRQTDLDRDYSQANYSSLRAAQQDVQRSMRPLQDMLGRQIAGEVYQRILPELAVSAGVTIPSDSAGRRRFYRYDLQPDGFPYVDPLKDAQGIQALIDSGLTTRKDEIAKRGGDYRQVWEQLAAEQKLLDDLGLTLGDKLEAVAPAASDEPAPILDSELVE